MVKLRVNNIEIEAEAGMTILEAARKNTVVYSDIVLSKRFDGNGCLPCVHMLSKRGT